MQMAALRVGPNRGGAFRTFGGAFRLVVWFVFHRVAFPTRLGLTGLLTILGRHAANVSTRADVVNAAPEGDDGGVCFRQGRPAQQRAARKRRRPYSQSATTTVTLSGPPAARAA